MSNPSAPFQEPVTYDQVTSRAQGIDLGDTPGSMRAGFTQLLLGEHPEPDTRPLIRVGGIEARLSGADSLEQAQGSVCIWLHGGGYVFGSPETHARVQDRFAEALGYPVLGLRYRLAPEHVWPAQLEDVTAAVHALQERGLKVLLAGDSAGGHLAINAALECAQSNKEVAGLALFSPNTDRSGLNTTRAVNDEHDPIVGDAFDTKLAHMCFPPTAWQNHHPQVSPVLADLSVLPRTHIEVGGRELLRDDSILLFAMARRAGADVSLHETPEAFHMWQVWVPWLSEGAKSLDRAAEPFRKLT